MFQTEVNLFLQAHGGPFWDALWRGVSDLGGAPAYLTVLIVVTFGVDLRRAWWLGVALLWTAGTVQYAKMLFALPRPIDVDSRVLYPPTGEVAQHRFTARGAASFLGSLPTDVVDYYRAHTVDWGLPSGHTATCSGFGGGLGLLFWRRRWWLATVGAAAVMGLSRMYLGRHFLADVLGGALLGGAAVAALRLTVSRRVRLTPWAAVAFLFVAPAGLLPLAWRHGDVYAAELWAWNLGFWVLVRRGREYAGGRPGQRVARVAVAVSVGGLSALALRAVLGALAVASPWGALLQAFGSVLFMLVGGVLLAERLGLYPPSAAVQVAVADRG
jgi:membrane-associated phospholipid phosphatase